jgi:hypothetical protein
MLSLLMLGLSAIATGAVMALGLVAVRVAAFPGPDSGLRTRDRMEFLLLSAALFALLAQSWAQALTPSG